MKAEPLVNPGGASPSLAERLRARWEAVGACPRPGVSVAEIEAFEEKSGVRLTRELRDYFLVVNGMEDWQSDPKWITHFFSLGTVKNVRQGIAEHGGTPGYRGIEKLLEDADHTFVIVDLMIGSQYLAACLTNEPAETGAILLISGTDFEWSAGSFTELAERYLADPEGLWEEAPTEKQVGSRA